MATQLQLIAGLGNPGAEYAATRHNVGMWWVVALAEKLNAPFKLEPKLKAHIAKVTLNHDPILLCLPTVYMNESGQSIQKITHFYKIKPKHMLIVHDELDLPCGSVRLKSGGGLGGHNGLKDITRAMGTQDYHRLRLGIDHPGHKHLVHKHVLGKPSLADKQTLDNVILESLRYWPEIADVKQWQSIMNQLHTLST